MNLATRRLAFGAVAAASALVAGLVIAPAVSAKAGALTLDPTVAQNTETARTITYRSASDGEADFRLGGRAVFTRVPGGQSFEATIPEGGPAASRDAEQSGPEDFTDEGNGLGQDGPADAGDYTVSATGNDDAAGVPGVGGGTDTCAGVCFRVLEAGPVAVTSTTPNSIRPSNKNNITIAGNNFERSSIVQFLFPDGNVDGAITVTAPTADAGCAGTVQTDKITIRTAIKRCVNVGSTDPGARDVRVTNLDGNSATCAGCFFVAGPPLTGVSPTGEFNDPTQGLTPITFTGTNVANGTPSLEYVGPTAGTAKNELAIIGTNVRNHSSSSITADFDLRNAAPGQTANYQPFVRGDNGIVNACDVCRFTVQQRSERTPTIDATRSLDSDTATAGIQRDIKQGETKVFFVYGTNYSKGASLVLTGAGLTVTNVEFVSPEQLRATIAAASNAAAGPRDATVRLTDNKTSNNCAGCINVVPSTPPPSGSASPSATPTATMSPRPQGCPSTPVKVTVNTKTINATGQASVTVTGATPSATIELQGYSQNHEGTMTFEKDPTPVDRVGRADANGAVTFNDLRPASNTRVRARQQGCAFGDSAVIEVRAQETLAVRRVGDRSYVFSGRSIPAREGGLIVSLYRITGRACPAGVEPRSCTGETFIGQGRAQSLGSPGEGLYSIRITFPARDENVRDEFVVKTGRDAQNAPGRSNARSLLIN